MQETLDRKDDLSVSHKLQLAVSLSGLQIISKWVTPQELKWKSFLLL